MYTLYYKRTIYSKTKVKIEREPLPLLLNVTDGFYTLNYVGPTQSPQYDVTKNDEMGV